MVDKRQRWSEPIIVYFLRQRRWLFCALVVYVLDQWSKTWILKNLLWGENKRITSWLNLVLFGNRGMAFSLLSGVPGVRGFFLCLGVGVSLWLVRELGRAHNALSSWGLSLILGGALGNLWDRWQYHLVIDFLDFHWRNYHYPAFNLADAAICTGLGLLLLGINQKK